MSFLDILHKLLTGPVELLMEVIVSMGIRIITNPGYITIFLSLVIGIPSLLLYRWAAAFQNSKGNKNPAGETSGPADRAGRFTGKISLPLVLELLLFAAAYFFFRDLLLIRGTEFLFLTDLGEQDALLQLGAVRINVLPVCALALRILASLIRLKDTGRGTRIGNLFVFLLFFALLYISPSAFVLYRLVFELLSLAEALISRMHNSQWILSIIISAVGLILMVYAAFFMRFDSGRKRLVILTALLLTQVPLLINFLSRKRKNAGSGAVSRNDSILFLINAVYLTILTGIQIPSAVISSAPTDFINISSYYSPVWYIVSALLLAAGTFFLWFGMIFRIASDRIRSLFVLLLTILSVWGTVNSMFYGNNFGLMSNQLEYEIMPNEPVKVILINFVILLLIALALVFIRMKKRAILSLLVLVLCVTKITSSAANLISIVRTLSTEKAMIAEQMQNKPVIPLSKTGKNVIVFMLDRSMGFYIPFIMAERPELMEKFDGFTFYPNTLSFATQTNEGAPALFGGYEYSPANINSRADVPLADKHNEALRLLPVLFDDAGYEVTVIDPPYAGYRFLADLEIFSDRPDIHAYRAEGLFSTSPTIQEAYIKLLNRNFFCYSVYRIAPVFIQPTLYASGSYNQVTSIQAVESLYAASGIRDNFELAYNVLLNLPAITEVSDEDINTYMAIDNRTTHEPVLLQLPDYTPAAVVDNTGIESSPITRTSADGRTLKLDNITKVTHYHSNMAAYLLVGEWLDYLRGNGVYDNTRIIIVADHGFPLGFKELKFGNGFFEDILTYNPVLMIKDFDSRGFTVDEQFMTNADVPSIALEGLIDSPVNPATGNPVNNDAKYGSEILVKHTKEWDIRKNSGETFLPGEWYRINIDNIFDPAKWEFLDIH